MFKKTILQLGMIATFSTVSVTGAYAFNMKVGVLNIEGNTTIRAGAQMRVQSQDCRLIGVSNGGCAGLGPTSDDGNLNYNKWDFTSATVSALYEIDISYKSFGFFGRINSFYDPLLSDDSHTQRTDLSSSAQDVAAHDIDILDAYLYKSFEIAGHFVNARLGNQAVNWGESLFVAGGINSSNPIALSQLRKPGAEIKEATKPTPTVKFSASVTDALTLEAYYQILWSETELDPVGTYFSTGDLVGAGAEGLFLSVDPGAVGNAAYSTPGNYIPKSQRDEARDSGQWGIAARYYDADTSALFGLYYLRYHAKTPVLGATADYAFVGYFPSPPFPPLTPIYTGVPTSYFEEYVEDIDLFGVSVSGPVGNVAVGFEVSYQPNFVTPLSFGDTLTRASDAATNSSAPVRVSGYARERRWQAHLSTNYSMSPSAFVIGDMLRVIDANSGVFLSEFVVTGFPSLDPTKSYDAPQFSDGVDDVSWGYRFLVSTVHDRVFNTNVSLEPSLSWQHDVSGNAPGGNGAPFIEDRKALSLGLKASYLTYGVNISYTNYFGAGASNLLTDRDYVAASISYSF